MSNPQERPTAGIIVIGNELLNGQIKDTNAHFLSKILHGRGILVRKITYVGDDIAEIVREVNWFRENYDYALTNGGIGLTHDDKTMEALAQTFAVPLQLNLELKTFVEAFVEKNKMKWEGIKNTIEKFCRLPKPMSLLWGEKGSESALANNTFPLYQIANVIVLPGVPQFCERSFEMVKDQIFPPPNPLHSKTIYLTEEENVLEQTLSAIANECSEDVSIGCYPSIGHNYFKTKLVVESSDKEKAESVHLRLVTEFADKMTDCDEEPWHNSHEKLELFAAKQSDSFRLKIQESLRIISEVLDKYTTGKSFLCFNGGKDCTVILHLLMCQMERRHPGSMKNLKVVDIVKVNDEFQELKDFVKETESRYGFKVSRPNGPIRAALQQLEREEPNLIVAFMGTRKDDPKGKYMKTPREWTDSDWPRFLRVCPILDWNYEEVWQFIRGLSIRYCTLYDQGYSSLGEKSKTVLNAALQKAEMNGHNPAYTLKDDQFERYSRHYQ